MGLSPRVRGNPDTKLPSAIAQRSIPARTGEPLRDHGKLWPGAVYPRAYGGTYSPHTALMLSFGLSPRVRGNRKDFPELSDILRSIPARTGEPPRRPA